MAQSEGYPLWARNKALCIYFICIMVTIGTTASVLNLLGVNR